MSLFDDVGAFHAKFGLPVAGKTPVEIPAEHTVAYRMKFLEEEFEEFQEACEVGALSDAADALADLIWVALGTAHYFGLPFDKIWAEVKRANMAKERTEPGDGTHHKRGPMEVMRKPEGWKSPDHEPAINRARGAFAAHKGEKP